MLKRFGRPLIALIVCGGFVAVMLLLAVVRDRPGVTPRNVAAIRRGMAYAEVESLMGCPSGTIPPEAADLAVESVPESFVLAPNGRNGAGHHWLGHRAAVFVVFDATGRVEEVRPPAVRSTTKPWWQFW